MPDGGSSLIQCLFSIRFQIGKVVVLKNLFVDPAQSLSLDVCQAVRRSDIVCYSQPCGLPSFQGSVRIQDLLKFCSTKPSEPEQAKKKALEQQSAFVLRGQ